MYIHRDIHDMLDDFVNKLLWYISYFIRLKLYVSK
jgi:hypothetical protein